MHKCAHKTWNTTEDTYTHQTWLSDSSVKYMEEQVAERGRYCCEMVSTSAITTSVSSTFLYTSAASRFNLSNWPMILHGEESGTEGGTNINKISTILWSITFAVHIALRHCFPHQDPLAFLWFISKLSNVLLVVNKFHIQHSIEMLIRSECDVMLL